MNKHAEHTPHAHGATHPHHPKPKKDSGGVGRMLLLLLVVAVAVVFWMNGREDPDVLNAETGSVLSGSNKPVEQENGKFPLVPGAQVMFGITGECEEMFAEYYGTYDNAITTLKDQPHPFGTADITTETWFDGAWTVSLVSGYRDPYGHTFTTYTSGAEQGFGYSTGDLSGGLVMFRNLSKDANYTGTAVFKTETGHFDQLQYSGFAEKYRPLIGKKAVPCLVKAKNGVCDYLYVGMIRFPDRTVHDVECYTQSSSGDVYLIRSVDALNIFDKEVVPADDFAKNYAIWNNAIVWFMNHIKKN